MLTRSPASQDVVLHGSRPGVVVHPGHASLPSMSGLTICCVRWWMHADHPIMCACGRREGPACGDRVAAGCPGRSYCCLGTRSGGRPGRLLLRGDVVPVATSAQLRLISSRREGACLAALQAGLEPEEEDCPFGAAVWPPPREIARAAGDGFRFRRRSLPDPETCAPQSVRIASRVRRGLTRSFAFWLSLLWYASCGGV